jgi:hypothetical protein
MIKKAVSISIPTQCHENWDNFISQAKGRFCESCSKTVVDFTKMSDDQILNYFKNQDSTACGRFRPEQLKVYPFTNPVKVQPGYTLLKAGLMSILLLVSSKTFSQTKPNKQQIEIAPSAVSESSDTSKVAHQVVSGTVIDQQSGDPIPGTNILLKGSVIGTVTDADGKFQFPEKLSEGDVLVFTFIGFDSKEYRVERESKVGVQLSLSLCMDMDIMGGVKVESLYSEPTSRLNRLWSKVKSVF